MNRIVTILVLMVLAAAVAQAQNPTTCKLNYPAGGEKFRPGTTQDLTWDTAGTYRAHWRFQFATSPSGPWTDLSGLTDVLDSAANRRGVFIAAWRVPTVKTTTGYIRMVLLNSDGSLNTNVTSMNSQPFEIEQPTATAADSVLSTAITGKVTLRRTKVYALDGYVFVDDGGVLAIEPGTIIIGDTVGQNSAICVNRGGKIIANGRADAPIIMTSSAPPGQRAPGDWGGLLICGKARTNHPGGQAALEGGIADGQQLRGWFGGSDDDDSSGVLRYVRVEFAGIAAAPNSELNSFTFGGVGRRTVMEYCQASYGNDDSFEWFGGTLSAKHIISIGCLDDDFDTDNGWSGKVQFGLSQRLRHRADQSTSEFFESDNDANATTNTPLTSGIFSNMTCVGPLQDTAWTSGNGVTPNTYNSRFGAAVQIRRNSRMSLFNSVIIGFPRGLEIANANSMAAAYVDSLQVRYCSWFGMKTSWLNLAGGTPPSGMTTSWVSDSRFNNTRASVSDSYLNNAFATDNNFNPSPLNGASYLTTASFVRDGVVAINDLFFQTVQYRGAFAPGERWDLPWAEYDPQNKEYKASSPVRLSYPAGGEKFSAGQQVDIKWDTTGTAGFSYKLQFATSKTGPWADVSGLTSIQDNGATRGTVKWTVPSTATKTGYLRLQSLTDDRAYGINDNAFEIAVVVLTPVAKLLAPGSAAGEKYRPGTSVDLKWDTTGTFRMHWKFQFGTSPDGPWTDLPGVADVLDSAANRRGVFAGGFRVPAQPTTTGYVRMVSLSDPNLSDVNDNPFTIDQPQATRADSVLRTPVTNRVQLSNTKIYSLDGYVFVDDGGVLAIEPGTIIIGDTVGQNSAICVNRGGKIVANGTSKLPIIMTSSAPPGQRAPGDWGGLLICGKARTNHPGGQAALEGGIADGQQLRGWFGGSDDDDSSGVLRYVRVEFAGIAAAPNSELNSFTFGGVGRRTVMEYCQASYGNDDSFEWFGGTLSAKHIISIGCLDDDFDTDNGWSGKVQFGLSQRLRHRADQSTSEFFESDNDANATTNTPLTSGIFSNMTCVGPLQDTAWTSGNGIAAATYNSRFGAAVQIRRNSRMSLYNSVIIGYPRALEIANANSMAAANVDSFEVRNVSWYGIKNSVLNLAGGTPPSGMTTDWINKAAFNNVVDKSSPAGAQLVNPFATDLSFNPLPQASAPYLNSASFARTGVVAIDDSFFEKVSYRGAFGGNVTERWDADWAEYDPQNKEYKAQQPVSVQEESGSNLKAYAYPNPASDAVTIRYSLPEDGSVSIELVDVLGAVQSIILENQQQHASSYEFKLNTSALASGMYFIRITRATGTSIVPLSVGR